MIKKTIQFISFLFFLLFVTLIGLIPFRLLYFLSDIIAWLLRKVFKYRYKVVLENITYSNLQLNAKEKQKLIIEIYRNLLDVLLEGIKSFTMSRSSILKRHKILNFGLIQPYYLEGKSIILVTGHFGNWEWGSLSAGIQTPYHILAFYKPLRNRYINQFLRRSRSKFGTTLAPIRKTSLSFEQQQGTPTVFLMAADQSPTKVYQAHWTTFFGRETAFLHGPEKHARNNNFPVVFSTIKRVKRGMYELTLSIIADKPLEYAPGEITRMYVQKLEECIREKPESWLWSHRRWKHKPQPEKTVKEDTTP